MEATNDVSDIRALSARKERKQAKRKAWIEDATNVIGAIVGALLHVARRFAHAATAHARDRLQGRAENATWKKDKERDTTARFKMAVQVSPGCQVNVREEGTKKEGKKERERETKERGDRCEGSLTDPRRPRRER